MSTKGRFDSILRSRTLRLSVATILVTTSAWAFSPYLGSRVASSAYVNAELVRVVSPLAGRLAHRLPSRGEYVARTHKIELVEALAPDQRHLFDLRQQLAVAKKRADLARKQLKEIKNTDRELSMRADAYRAGMLKRILAEIEEAAIENKGCLAEAKQRGHVGDIMKELTKRGIASQLRSAEVLASKEATMTRCEVAEARIKRLKVELASAQNGVFLRDGINDVPYSQQQRDRLMLRRQDFETELLNQNANATQLKVTIQEEIDRLARANHFELTLPAGHVVWSVAASPGATVVVGQYLMDLADCRHRFIAVEMPERDFDDIKAGDRAFVRLVGSDAWIDGHVRQERGSAARADDQMLAAKVTKPHSGAITVEVELPGDVWREDKDRNFCNIGRLAEVRFPRYGIALPSIVRHTLDWFADKPVLAANGSTAVSR
jgi:multidrug resistance efflux pump